jgi:hypothetical protein
MEALHTINDLISSDLFGGFGLYSVLWVVSLSFFKSNKLIESFDASACKFVVWLGIISTVLWASEMIIYYVQMEDIDEKNRFENRMRGPYAYGLFVQALVWLGLSQLLRLERLKSSRVFRILSGLFFLLTFERMIILITSMHRDYTADIFIWPQILFAGIINLAIFVLLNWIFILVTTGKNFSLRT